MRIRYEAKPCRYLCDADAWANFDASGSNPPGTTTSRRFPHPPSVHHMITRLFGVVLLLAMPFAALAQGPKDYTVALRARYDAPSRSITISWPASADGKQYEVYRKLVTDENFSTEPIQVLDSTARSYTDTGRAEGIGYEYRVLRLSRRQVGTDSVTKAPVFAQWIATGYIVAGSRVVPSDRGRVLVLIDSTMQQPLVRQMDTLRDDLEAEGWLVKRRYVPRAETFDSAKVMTVRNLIKEEHKADPLAAIILVGRVPVPYSGNTAPDGHRPDHYGAWPADGIYGDVNGVYNDRTVDNRNTQRPANANIPGDGKYDPSIFTTPVEVPVGRIDFFNMPVYSATETDLLKRYFQKNHAFRSNAWTIRSGGIIDDNFGTYGEVFAASAWRSFVVFGGDTTVRAGDFFGDLAGPTTYQFGYGCGGGTNTSAGGVGTSDDFAAKPAHAVFSLLFGSYFGDWDTQNNFMRASVASDPRILVCGWSGRPHWYLHHMAMGETIGYGLRISQNNQTIVNSTLGNYVPNVVYSSQGAGVASIGDRGIHIALMGDPTLRSEMIPVPQVASAVATAEYPNKVNITWTPPTGSVDGYMVYRAVGPTSRFQRLTPAPITSTTYQDSLRHEGAVRYRIVCASLRSTPASGTYFDMGRGIETSVTTTGVDDDASSPAYITIAPNPTHQGAVMTVAVTGVTPIDVTVHDMTGRTVWAFSAADALPGSHTLRWDGTGIDGGDVPSGRYLVRVVTADGVHTQLLTVLR